MSQEEQRKVVKLMARTSAERASQPAGLPRKLITGLMALGFGAVFGVLGMFFMPYSTIAGITLLVLAAGAAITGVILVMKYGGDARFDPKPVVITHAHDSTPPPHDRAS